MYAPISKFGGSNHGSPIFLTFGCPVMNSPTHSPKSLDHFLLIEKDNDNVWTNANVHCVTRWEL